LTLSLRSVLGLGDTLSLRHALSLQPLGLRNALGFCLPLGIEPFGFDPTLGL
jgi:hypothetical protein